MAKKGCLSGKPTNEDYHQLPELIEALTHSGQKTLDTTTLNKLKCICKQSDKNVEQAYHLILHQLEKNHSEIRYSAFQLCDEIFRRSHCFRQLIINNLRQILELTAETNLDRPLPQPRTAALNLKKLSLRTISEWYKKYGPRYKMLVVGFNFLKQCKKIDFNALQLQNDAERARELEKERRLQMINKERIKKVEQELKEFGSDISTSIKTLMNGLDLLLPKLENFFISLDDENEDTPKDYDLSDEESNRATLKEDPEQELDSSSDDIIRVSENYDRLRDIGALNSKHSIEINLKIDDIKCLRETPENQAILDSIRDEVKLITNNYLPRVKGWLQILTKASGDENLIKNIVNLKTNLESSLGKYSRLKINNLEEDCVSTDSELEEVKDKEVDNKYCKNKTDRREWSILSKEEKAEDPTTIQARTLSYVKRKAKKPKPDKMCTNSNEPQPSSSKDYAVPSTSTSTDDNDINNRKKKLLAVAPKVPFDIDLYHWEDEKLETPTLLPTSIDQNKFWSSVSGDDFMELPVPESALRTRVIEFVGEFTPVTKSCRAPISNGKLCPRKDRFKCPFHGVIVPRDETGKCINPEDEEKFQRAEEEKRVPDWQDPKLLKELKEATGIDLKMPDKKGKRNKKKKYPGLTDLKAKQNTVKNRLSKKLFNKASVKRVAQTLDNIDHRRFRDKYGDQFHYMYNTA